VVRWNSCNAKALLESCDGAAHARARHAELRGRSAEISPMCDAATASSSTSPELRMSLEIGMGSSRFVLLIRLVARA